MLLVIVRAEGFTKVVLVENVVMEVALLLLAQGKIFVVTSNLMWNPFILL